MPMDRTKSTLRGLARDLAMGSTSSRRLIDASLARIEDPKGEGPRAFIHVDTALARKTADLIDEMRASGLAPSPYAGIPIGIKDLANIRGQVTRAGSKVLAEDQPWLDDAPVVARLRAAGFVIVGRTNMTEFAYSGLGINPHYGTPLSPWDRASKRVPGGSSSGSGVAVADGMVHGALGTDTGGSCRIPAAFNGVVGYKPTARRVPTGGVVPLSTSLDSIGPIAGSVDCCRIMDAIMAGETLAPSPERSLAGARFLVPETVMLDGLDKPVAADFEAALARLAKAGARITRGKMTTFDMMAVVVRKGGLSAAESYHWHKDLIAKKQNQYDPRVLARIMRGPQQSAADYLDLLQSRAEAIAKFNSECEPYDAVLSPTVPILAPRIADCVTEDEYNRLNMLTLRNTAMLNIVDGCSIALPMHKDGSPPTSLMMSAPAMADQRLFAFAEAVEGELLSIRD